GHLSRRASRDRRRCIPTRTPADPKASPSAPTVSADGSSFAAASPLLPALTAVGTVPDPPAGPVGWDTETGWPPPGTPPPGTPPPGTPPPGTPPPGTPPPGTPPP